MDQVALVKEEIDQGRDLIEKLNNCFRVESAFWLNPSDDGGWSLYIASSEINDSNFDVAYGEVLRIASEIDAPDLDPFRVRVIGSDDSLARAARDIHQKYPGLPATRLRVGMFGGMGVEQVYLYPELIPETTASPNSH